MTMMSCCRLSEKRSESSDMVLISGGSSVGTKDLTLRVMEAMGKGAVSLVFPLSRASPDTGGLRRSSGLRAFRVTLPRCFSFSIYL